MPVYRQAAGPSGDGIVIAAGKALRLGNVWVTLRVLRQELHSSLPVEIWHLGKEELDDVTKAHIEVQLAQADALTLLAYCGMPELMKYGALDFRHAGI